MLFTILFLSFPFRGEQRQDSVVVSLLTCAPGEEIYQLCGHAAVRVRGGGIDSVWNYGLFSFDQPNFVYRFVKGETDYMLGAYPYSMFLMEYQAEGRRVVEQDLNLSPEVRDRLIALLRWEALPENSVYRYNYVKDNCATRIIDRVEEASGERIIFPDSLHYGTFRRQMRAYHGNYPWYQFGIDLALGSGIDYPLRPREEMFVPEDLAHMLSGSHFESGKEVVSESRIALAGAESTALPPTDFWLTPLFTGWVIFAIAVILCLVMWKRKQVLRWTYTLWYGICGIAGCIIAFLVFVSEHEATSPNVLILWLNPMQLIFAACVWIKGKGELGARLMAWYDIIVVTLLLLVWPFQSQSANAAFFPMMGTTVALAATYLVVKGNSPAAVSRSGTRRRTATQRKNKKRK